MIRILLLLLIVLGLALALVQGILWSDLPRRIVLSTLRDQTGLAIDADTLRTGWRGRTTLTNLRLGLPLEPDPIITVPRVQVDHSALLWIVLGGALELDRVDLDQPRITLKPDDQERWNLLLAADILTDALGGDGGGSAMPPRLPTLRIRDARVRIAAPDGTLFDLDPIHVRGDPAGAMAWRFEARAGQRAEVHGRLAPRSAWAHELTFDLDDLRPMIEPWWPEVPRTLEAAGTWHGQVRHETLRGTLRLTHALAAPWRADGELGIDVRGLSVALRPADLAVRYGEADPLAARLDGGTLTLNPQEATIDRLGIRTAFADAQVSGSASLLDRTGRLSMQVAGTGSPYLPALEARLTLGGALPRVGAASLNATVNGEAALPAGRATLAARFDAEGDPAGAMTGQLTAQTLRWDGDEAGVDLSGLTLHGQRRGSVVELASLAVPGRQAAASGSYDTRSREWGLRVSLEDWPTATWQRAVAVDALPWLPGPSLALRLEAEGRGRDLTLHELRLADRAFTLHAQGHYAPEGSGIDESEDAVRLVATLEADLPDGLPESRAAGGGAAGVRGRLRASLEAAGAAQPLDLSIRGTLQSRALTVAQHAWADATIELSGRADQTRLGFAAERVVLLDGVWALEGDYAWAEGGSVTLRAENAALASVAAGLGLPIGLDGRADLLLTATLTNDEPASPTVTGRWAARRLAAAGLALGEGEGEITLSEGRLTLDPIRLRQDGGAVAAEARWDRREPDAVHLSIEADDWPIRLPALPLTMIVDGQAGGTYDATRREGAGAFDLSAALRRAGRPLGRFALAGDLDRRTLTLASLRGEVLGGVVTGEGAAVLDASWQDSHAALSWHGIDLDQLNPRRGVGGPAAGEAGEAAAENVKASDHADASPTPGLLTQRWGGRSSGTLRVARDPDPRADEPMRLDIEAFVEDGFYGPIRLGPTPFDPAAAAATEPNAEPNAVRPDNENHTDTDADIDADAGVTEPPLLAATVHFGPQRIMGRSITLHLAGGRVEAWGRATPHEGQWSAHATAQLHALDLDPLAEAIGLAQGPMPGRVGGDVSLGGYLRPPHRWFGRAMLDLTESDIARAPGITTLFNALRLDISGTDPTGYGQAELRLEGPALELAKLRYFNRGIDVLARMRIDNVAAGGNSPVSGIATGSVRPLMDADLPFFGNTFDRMLRAVQSNAAAVIIFGTVGEAQSEVRPLVEVTDALGRLLRGTPQ